MAQSEYRMKDTLAEKLRFDVGTDIPRDRSFSLKNRKYFNPEGRGIGTRPAGSNGNPSKEYSGGTPGRF